MSSTKLLPFEADLSCFSPLQLENAVTVLRLFSEEKLSGYADKNFRREDVFLTIGPPAVFLENFDSTKLMPDDYDNPTALYVLCECPCCGDEWLDPDFSGEGENWDNTDTLAHGMACVTCAEAIRESPGEWLENDAPSGWDESDLGDWYSK